MKDYSYEEAVKIDINVLKTHPKNEEIYGDDDINELAEKIKKSGYVKPLYTNKDYVIISGHRRYKACLSLGYGTVPIVVKTFKDKQEELEILLLENIYREKTVEQKVKEAEIWEAIEKEKAEKRRLEKLKQNTVKDKCPERTKKNTEGENFPPRENNPKENFPKGEIKNTVKENFPERSEGYYPSVNFALKSLVTKEINGTGLKSLKKINDKIKELHKMIDDLGAIKVGASNESD